MCTTAAKKRNYAKGKTLSLFADRFSRFSKVWFADTAMKKAECIPLFLKIFTFLKIRTY